MSHTILAIASLAAKRAEAGHTIRIEAIAVDRVSPFRFAIPGAIPGEPPQKPDPFEGLVCAVDPEAPTNSAGSRVCGWPF